MGGSCSKVGWAQRTRGKSGRFWTERGDTYEGEVRNRDKIDWRKRKIPAGFLSSELYSRARGVTQSWAVGPELLNTVFCSKARSTAVLDVSAEGAKMVGVGRGMATKHLSSFTRVLCTVIFKGKLHLFLNTLIYEATECSEELLQRIQQIRTNTHTHTRTNTSTSVSHFVQMSFKWDYVSAGMVWPTFNTDRWIINIVKSCLWWSLCYLLLHKAVI